MESRLQVGIVSSTHGVHGEVKVFPTTDDPTRFEDLKDVILDLGREQRVLEVEKVRYFKQFVILKWKGIDTLNEVEKFRGCSLFVTRENAVACEEDEYFIADLIDMKVLDEDGKELGKIKDVMQTGANDVYIITMKDGRELLLPAIFECVKEVNLSEGYVKVHILDGLLD